jgi:hypothetical protein
MASTAIRRNAVLHVGQYPINSKRIPEIIVPVDVPTDTAVVTSPIVFPIRCDGTFSAIVARPRTKMKLLANA